MQLKGKHILVGVTGGIAAYKTPILVREFVRRGAEVKVVMTPMAKQFVTPLTLATVSKNPIVVDFFDPENGQWNSHVSLGTWADAYVIAPATANTMAKMANGVADNLLLTTYLSARCTVFAAPAMDLDMMRHPATVKNIETLRERGVEIIEAEDGELASGLSGKGRMAEPADIAFCVESYFARRDGSLKGRKVLVTAGPTYEKIDPVRFIGNYSSGKMGYAIAEELASRGASVVLVSGPVKISARSQNIDVQKVESAKQMLDKAKAAFADCDAAIMTAAVADFAPADVAEQKIKRHGDFSIQLVANPDIAAELGRMKSEKQIIAGFALETNDEMNNAHGKLEKKNMDFIVLNSLADKGAGFMTDTNKVTIIEKNGTTTPYPLKSKADVAIDIIDTLERLMSTIQK
ncbi:MAG: bifunctional phosphopantothenoylcysteine decarboxylase/phosphopantothenate--cysteine ligase CoaBC [Bacteroidales bacterium]|nr:bifunctional phosphopantothenoylcysteine decarboxylase/phosphopantothenate--cysteine ligase CoaBC [Bacteroidales bacterium]MDY4174767.1 bifunctional phosphopantothenoylcysteine decarboxylase/phosphopantothenate--cysteine ligase CoaBC [Bacteroidales bacterium]